MTQSQRMTDEEAAAYWSLPPRERYKIAKAAGTFDSEKEFRHLRGINARWEEGSACDPLPTLNEQFVDQAETERSLEDPFSQQSLIED